MKCSSQNNYDEYQSGNDRVNISYRGTDKPQMRNHQRPINHNDNNMNYNEMAMTNTQRSGYSQVPRSGNLHSGHTGVPINQNGNETQINNTAQHFGQMSVGSGQRRGNSYEM